MSRGLSLHIGLNSVDRDHYAGWSGDLVACERDAKDMKAVASTLGYSPTILLTKEATRDAVLAAIRKAVGKLTRGDIFFLSYSGHGGTTRDMDDNEPTGKDSTWCLYDGQLIDDEIYISLGAFEAGVRIITLSDSCHSGTVLRLAHKNSRDYIRYRAIPQTNARETYLKNKTFYDDILSSASRRQARESVSASALLLSGCQDDQLSADGPVNGAFTGALLAEWDSGRFKGNYRTFYDKIRARLPRTQIPNWFTVGPSDQAFYGQKPFSIELSATASQGVVSMPIARTSDDADAVARLIELGSSPASCERLRAKAKQAMVPIYGKPTFKNACAATLSIFLQEAGLKIKLEYGAGRLAKSLRDRGWQRVDVGDQQPGDVGVTKDNMPPAGADHVFLVVEALGSDKMIIADNQTSDCPHTRYASGRDGRTPCDYFLRAPGFTRSRDAETDPIEFVYEDEDTNDLVVNFDDRGAPL